MAAARHNPTRRALLGAAFVAPVLAAAGGGAAARAQGGGGTGPWPRCARPRRRWRSYRLPRLSSRPRDPGRDPQAAGRSPTTSPPTRRRERRCAPLWPSSSPSRTASTPSTAPARSALKRLLRTPAPDPARPRAEDRAHRRRGGGDARGRRAVPGGAEGGWVEAGAHGTRCLLSSADTLDSTRNGPSHWLFKQLDHAACSEGYSAEEHRMAGRKKPLEQLPVLLGALTALIGAVTASYFGVALTFP
jgi:hypothetical protein